MKLLLVTLLIINLYKGQIHYPEPLDFIFGRYNSSDECCQRQLGFKMLQTGQTVLNLCFFVGYNGFCYEVSPNPRLASFYVIQIEGTRFHYQKRGYFQSQTSDHAFVGREKGVALVWAAFTDGRLYYTQECSEFGSPGMYVWKQGGLNHYRHLFGRLY